MSEFKAFDKIARLNRECIATEKIDGTNGVIWIAEDLQAMKVGSRSRWITPDDDNYGFARWAYNRLDELVNLGPGYHYGEWWGAGIQRRYGLSEKRFSLFNVARWGDIQTAKCSKCTLVSDAFAPLACSRCGTIGPEQPPKRPACCGVVPELARGMDIREVTETALAILRANGSQAVPGFMKPEGIVVYHTAASMLFKVTLEKDEAPKGQGQS